MLEAKRYINILSIDGGGIRGIIPATILARIERKIGLRIHEAFDLIAGTSTGGIIAAAIGAGANGGSPYTPDDLVNLYIESGPEIFQKTFLTDVENWIRPKYSPEQLPRRMPSFLTPLTRRTPAAKSALRRPQSAAS